MLKSFTDESNKLIPRINFPEESYINLMNKINNSKGSVDILEESQPLLTFGISCSLLKNFTHFLSNTYSSLKNLSNSFSNKRPNITLDVKHYYLSIIIDESEARIDKFIIKEKNITASILRTGKQEMVSLIIDKVPKTATLQDSFPNTLFEFIFFDFLNEVNSIVGDLYFLPASRSGLSVGMNAFGPILAELSKNRFLIKSKIELPSLPEHISDYYLRLTSIDKSNGFSDYQNIGVKIENEVLKGEVIYDDIHKKLLYKANSSLILELQETSSMVSELMPIVAHFKYLINNTHIDPNERISNTTSKHKTLNKENSVPVIFIEEPEAHLHPEAQVTLLEILTSILKTNIKLVITSHSNYMFNKLCNLIIMEKVDYKLVDVFNLITNESGTIDSKTMKPESLGIEDDNFYEVAEKLYNERLEVSSRD